jgi:hypothetical protein
MPIGSFFSINLAFFSEIIAYLLVVGFSIEFQISINFEERGSRIKEHFIVE